MYLFLLCLICLADLHDYKMLTVLMVIKLPSNDHLEQRHQISLAGLLIRHLKVVLTFFSSPCMSSLCELIRGVALSRCFCRVHIN